MDQLHGLFARLHELYSSLASLVYVVAGAVLAVLLVMAVYRYLTGSHKLTTLFDEVLAAVGVTVGLALAAGILNGSLFPATGWPYQLIGLLLTLYVLKHLRK